MHSGKPSRILTAPSTRNEDACQQLSRRYSFIASFCEGARWKRAKRQYLIRLAWAQIYRRAGSTVLYDDIFS